MRALADLLRLAYSAEHAATLAYLGHAASLRDPAERAAVLAIAAEEVQHRAHLDRMMRRIGIRPSRWLELKYRLIGSGISCSCHVIGWFMPMYFAGRLESGNVVEYVRMAELIAGTPLADEHACVWEMAVVEKRHEIWFRERIAGHAWIGLFSGLFGWGPGRSRNAMPDPEPALALTGNGSSALPAPHR